MQEFIRTRADVVTKITLTLDQENLRLKMGDKEEVNPVKSLVEDRRQATTDRVAGWTFLDDVRASATRP